MNLAHLHMILNHFPIATLIFGFVILVVGRLRRNETIIRVALGILIVGAFAGLGAFFTGDPAEDVIKSRPGFMKDLVHEHEKAADFGLWATIITGCTALAALYFSMKKSAIPKWLMIALFIINFWALTVLARVNYLGGQISHPEIRSESK
jgi:uncharacterized membrane protein